MEHKRRILPPVWFLLSMFAMLALHLLWPGARVVPEPYNWLGIVPLALGLVVSLSAVKRFGRAGTPVVPFERSTALVTGGAYRYTRNPMYLSLVVMLTGIAILFGTLTPWLLIPFFVWVIATRFIRGEERFMEDLFGTEYLAYKTRVRRWL
jgi:protein-S-isoprenylcysteine O-methyltransferase Ste14